MVKLQVLSRVFDGTLAVYNVRLNVESLKRTLCVAYWTSRRPFSSDEKSHNNSQHLNSRHTADSATNKKAKQSTAALVQDIKGSEATGGQQLVLTKDGGVKRIVKVVPTASKSFDGTPDVSRRASKLITAVRATNEYCLTEKHLESLPKFERRSAYLGEVPTVMYTEFDVERLAIQVHGSKAKQRRLSFQAGLMHHSKFVFEELPHPSAKWRSKEREPAASRAAASGAYRVVLTAIGVNAANAALKFAMCAYTGSHSLFAEGVHSLADTLNQIILAVGINQSIKKPDTLHPYGYSNVRYVTSLISGVGIFFLGTGLSVYHGIHGLMSPNELQPAFWSFILLGCSLLSECGTLLYAYNNIKKKAATQNLTIKQFVWEGHEPSLNVVLLEDCAAVLGVSIAAASLALSQYFNSIVPDALGSVVIGGLLGIVASFIVYTNSVHLVGKSMPQDEIFEVVRDLETDPVVRSVQDVKTTELGDEQTRFKAEVDLDGYHMTKAYLKTQDLNKLLEDIKRFDKPADVEAFLLCHGEQIVDRVGAEIDRIEQDLKLKHPDLRHVDLEVL